MSSRSDIPNVLCAGKVDEGMFRVCVDECYVDAVTYVETVCTVNDLALNRRIEDANEGALVADSCNHSMKVVADAVGQSDGGDALDHSSFDFA